MNVYQLGAADVLASLHTGESGLAAPEAQRRLRQFGPNRVEHLRSTPWWQRWLRPFTHFFALILWVAAALAWFAEYRQPGSGMGLLACAIVGVIAINGVFSLWQESRVEGALAALRRLLPHQVKVVRDGRVSLLDAEVLVPGDVVVLEAGDAVPADCRILQSYGAAADNATITGESAAQPRDADPSDAESVVHARNILLAGTSLAAGEARAVVFATGMSTEFGRIARLTQTADAAESPLLREIRILSRLVAVLAMSLGVLFFFIGRSAGLSFWATFIFAIGVIVANVPEGLLPTITMALSLGAQRMARRMALVRHLPSVETLGSATVICTDKTGTLTLNRMTVRRLFDGDRVHSAPLDPARFAASHRRLLEVARSCHSLKEGRDGWLGDPLEVSLVDFAAAAVAGAPAPEPPRVDVIPFDSDRRRLSTLHRTPAGLVLYTKGALESLLPRCARVQEGDAEPPLDEARRRRFLDAENAMAADGLRVLALAARAVEEGAARETLEQSLTLLGLVGFDDPPRPEVPAAVERCHAAGIRVIMVTGDHPTTAAAIAREIGLARGGRPRIVTGQEIARFSDTQLRLALRAPDLHFARVAADQKMRIVRALREDGETVAVTGDGVNDAPALKFADIGIAMGLSGTDVARESADMVLLDDNFANIVHAVEEGRGVYENIRRFLTYILTSNVAELVPYLAFAVFGVPLPLTIIQILAVDLGTDLVPALGLGIERPGPELMKRPPRARSERLLNAGLLGRAYLVLGPLEAVASMAAFFFVLRGGGWSPGAPLGPPDPLYLQATTACLSAIVVTQIVNVFLCRDARASIVSQPLFGNRLILAGIATEIVLLLLIVYTPAGNALFGTAPIGGAVWRFMLPFAAGMLIVEEARKALVRRSGMKLGRRADGARIERLARLGRQ